jgi:Flp pilus assembly protein TadG
MRGVSTLQPFREERGQAIVEFALVIPLLLALVTGIIQLSLLYNHQLTVNDALRQVARQVSACRFASGSTDPKPQFQTDIGNAGMTPSNAGLTTSQGSTWSCPASGTSVTLSGSYPDTVSIYGLKLLSVTLSSSETVAIE